MIITNVSCNALIDCLPGIYSDQSPDNFDVVIDLTAFREMYDISVSLCESLKLSFCP